MFCRICYIAKAASTCGYDAYMDHLVNRHLVVNEL